MTHPDLDALAALLDKATPGHHPLSTAESAAQHMADAKDEIVRALPGLLAYVRELERERDAAALAMRERCAQRAESAQANGSDCAASTRALEV